MASTGLVVRKDEWESVTELVLAGISSCHTRRAYSQALEEFLIWFRDEPNRQFNKATVQKYRSELETKGLAPSSINVRLSAIRRLALEASSQVDNFRMPWTTYAELAAATLLRARSYHGDGTHHPQSRERTVFSPTGNRVHRKRSFLKKEAGTGAQSYHPSLSRSGPHTHEPSRSQPLPNH